MGNSVTGIELKIKDVYMAKEVRERVQKNTCIPVLRKGLDADAQEPFSALKLEKLAMFVILVLIILVASFNIVGTLIMNVIEKSREIAILKAMGATKKALWPYSCSRDFL